MINPQKLPIISKYLWAILILIAGIVYALTIAPTVQVIDSGELAAVLSTASIAHPTGYPLFTMLGWLWTRLPLFGTEIFALNVLSMVFCLGALYFFIRSSQFFVGKFRVKTAEEGDKKSELQIVNLVSVLSGGLFLAFSSTFWTQALSIEVYSLHLLLIAATIYFLLRAYFSKRAELKPWLFLAGSLALCFTNHMSTIMILPLIAWMFFAKHGFNLNSFKRIGLMLAVFFPILLLIYSFLPLRAASDPDFIWGNPETLENFFRHASGWQFRLWVFESQKAFRLTLGNFVTNFLPEFGWIGIVPAVVGAWYLINRIWKIGIGLLLSFLFCILWASAYNIKDIDAYFLLAYVITAVWIVFGLRYLLINVLTEKFRKIGLAAFMLIPILPLALNYSSVDQRGVYVYEDYVKHSLIDLPENAMVIGTRWDYHLSASWYYQQVEELRPDVAVIDFELLRRSWYFEQLTRQWPDLFVGHETQVDNFLKELAPFERDELKDPRPLQAAFDSVLVHLVFQNSIDRPIYIAPEFLLIDIMQEKKMQPPPKGSVIVPMRYFFRLKQGDEYIPIEGEEPEIRWPERWDLYSSNIQNWVAFMRVERALYEKRFGEKEKAQYYIDLAKRDHPNYRPIVPSHQNFDKPVFLEVRN